MTTRTLPYFHADALREQFHQWLKPGLSSAALSANDCQWLATLEEADTELRVDSLEAVTADGESITLSACWLLSHSAQQRIGLYHPTLGVSVYTDRVALKQALLGDLDDPSKRLQLLGYTTAQQWRVLEQARVVDVEATRVEQPGFEALSITINEQLTLQLKELDTTLKQAPNPRQLLRNALLNEVISRWPNAAPPVVVQVQITDTSPLRCLSLTEAALDYLAQPQGQRYRWIQRSSEPCSEDDSETLLAAFAATHKNLAEHVARGLENHWVAGENPRAQLLHALRCGVLEAIRQCAWQQLLSAAEQRALLNWLTGQYPNTLCAHRLQFKAEGASPVGLLGLFAIAPLEHSQTPIYLYSAVGGLQRFASVNALQAHLLDPTLRFRWLDFIAPQARDAALDQTLCEITLSPAAEAGIDHALGSIFELQAAHLTQLLGHSSPFDYLTACHRALDLGAWLDPRLQRLEPAADSAEDVPASVLVTALSPRPTLETVKQVATTLHSRRPTLQSVSLSGLEAQLATLLKNDQYARNLVLSYTSSPSGSATELPLLAMLGSSVSRPTDALRDYQGLHVVEQRPGMPRASLQAVSQAMLSHALERSARSLGERWQAACERFEMAAQFIAGRYLEPQHCRMQLWRAAWQLELQLVKGQLAVDVRNTLEYVLEQPLARLRAPRDGVEPQVYQQWGEDNPLPDRLLVTGQPLANLATATPLILWSPNQGFEVFASLQALKGRTGAEESAWALIESDPFRVLVNQQREHRKSQIGSTSTLIVDTGMPPATAQDLANAQLGHDPLCGCLERLNDLRHQQAFNAQVPGWLANASSADQEHYILTLGQALSLDGPNTDYLFDIPDLLTYANRALKARLDVDFGIGTLAPEPIQLTTRQYVIAPVPAGEIPSSLPAGQVSRTRSLAEYAIGHFSVWEGEIARIDTGTGQPPPSGFTPAYIRSLVKQLDIGGHYQALLETGLSAQDPDYTTRVSLYSKHLAAQLRESALRARLQGELSATACHYVETLVHSPQSATDIGVGPLALIAGGYLPPDVVHGLYLIGPAQQGPVVLYSPYEAQTFRAFDSREALLHALNNDTHLQQRVLEKLDTVTRRIYDHGGFAQPHLPISVESDFDLPLTTPGPVRLSTETITSNPMAWLFEANSQLLKEMARAQSVTSAQARWNSFTHLLSLGLEQFTLFLPGKLGMLLMAWQTQLIVTQAYENARQGRWSEALAQVVGALIQWFCLSKGLHSENVAGSEARLWKQLPIRQGGVLTHLSGAYTRRAVEREAITILAVGIAKIRRQVPYRARLIRKAHRQAVDYLATAFNNLDAPQLHPRTAQIICDFFDIQQVTPAVLELLQKTCNTLLSMLVSPTYSPRHSSRYVMATKPAGIEGNAFMVPMDGLQQIFLMDSFFDFNFTQRLPLEPGLRLEQADTSSRAAVLIHEFSHLALNTRDIQYIEATVPFTDWILPGLERNWLLRQHNQLFSTRTPNHQLFTLHDQATGQTRDLEASDKRGKAFILKTTGAKNLNEARVIFMNDELKRIKVMLGNADSVTLFMIRLGWTAHH
ncbi:dermonecrotic toxin domain-containing protein [Pseudomonas sp. R5(2019)]|uniref:dermonecrotic toxin domain-containing protein n=1 Tax=Pseudomonas sp. R5(2019) TaxID=2697566 RepID=UPI001413000B|nr:DUF6543 domain-containing protein [Pseudomonas sp. R5(2019)]NBA98041.1 hypothetical protein [Pseudomonas sp. R5(2019)]